MSRLSYHQEHYLAHQNEEAELADMDAHPPGHPPPSGWRHGALPPPCSVTPAPPLHPQAGGPSRHHLWRVCPLFPSHQDGSKARSAVWGRCSCSHCCVFFTSPPSSFGQSCSEELHKNRLIQNMGKLQGCLKNCPLGKLKDRLFHHQHFNQI